MAESVTPTNGGSDLPGSVWGAGTVKELGKAIGLGNLEAGWVDDLVRKHVLAHGSGGSAILSIIASNVDDILAVAVDFLGKAQGGGQPGFYTAMAVILGDILGVELNADTIHNAWRRGGSMAGFRAVGEAYWKAMLGQLGSPRTLTPEGGLASAQGFLGYLLGFSIREGNLALIESVIPEEWRVIDGIEEYPRAMRQALGLGRMARQALHPLIQTLITDPLQWYVNSQYHPKLLGESLAVRAFNRGWIDLNALNQELLYAGYTSQRAEVLQQDALTYLSPNDAWENYTHGVGDNSTLGTTLTQNGFNGQDVTAWVQARTFQAVQPYVDQLIADWKGQWLTGYITLSQLEAYLDSVPMLPEAKNALKQAWGQLGEYPRRKLTLAEVQAAFVEGIYILDDVTTFLQGEGYSDDAITVLTLQTMLKLGTQEAKVAVAQYSYDKAVAKAAAAGQPKPPPPPILVPGPLG